MNLGYYLHELTKYKVDFDETKVIDWLSDTTSHLCEIVNIPQTAMGYRTTESERILARTLFAVQQIYATEEGFYGGVDLNKTIDMVDPRYLARRIARGDDCPFRAAVDINKGMVR
jgi:hypothetical protein